MNVARAPVSSNSDPVNVSARQDRNAAGKGDGSNFSQTLGSIDKNGARQGSASGSSDATDTKSTGSTTDASTQSAPSSGQDASSKAAPDAAKTAVADKAKLPGSMLPDLNLLPDTSAEVANPVADQNATALPVDADALEKLTDGLGDLAKLVNALTKTSGAKAAEADDPANAADGKGEDEAKADQADTGDILSLLAASAMQGNQAANAQNGAASQQPSKAISSEPASATLGDDPLNADVATSSPATVRLQKQDAPAVDLHIDTHEDGSMKVDISVASGNPVDVVQVVESRRYLGLAPTSNGAALTTAMTSDPHWSTALTDHAAGKPLIASTGQVVHTLKIQMNPVELGHVTAALKLVGDELSVHLTAHTLKGYAELQKDSSAILDALKSQGFSVDQVSVNYSSATDRQDSGAGNRQQQGDMGQQSAQFGSQRGSDQQPQEQLHRQTRVNTSDEGINHDTVQPEASVRSSSARSGQLYL